MELDEMGLPVREDTAVEVGSVRVGRSEWRVRVVEGERGGVSMPLVDIREYILPPTVEQDRYHAPGTGNRGKVRKSFTGFTRKGVRLTSDGAEALADAIAAAVVLAGSREEAGAA